MVKTTLGPGITMMTSAARPKVRIWSRLITQPRYGAEPSPSLENRGGLEPLGLERLLLGEEETQLLRQLRQRGVVAGCRGDLAVQRGLLDGDPLELPVDPGQRLAGCPLVGAAD